VWQSLVRDQVRSPVRQLSGRRCEVEQVERSSENDRKTVELGEAGCLEAVPVQMMLDGEAARRQGTRSTATVAGLRLPRGARQLWNREARPNRPGFVWLE
jgi:hypothetical protein